MPTVLLAGGSGLIGSALLQCLMRNHDVQVLLPLRNPQAFQQRIAHESPEFAASGRVTLLTYDQLLHGHHAVDYFFCALGTTRKQAGKAGLFAVDYQLVVDCAGWALKHGARCAAVVSALGANARSAFFYNRVKGQMEQALEALAFEHLHVWQPSLLLGERAQPRLLETCSGYLLSSPLWGNLQAMEGARIAEAMVAAAFSETKENPSVVRYRVADVKRLTA
ncbi:hypothetical protein ACQUQU_06695 [Thalassolituus sp. LLYu03]|uniref:hypothetical protein n=1 Tax=Thalassolituus sp. LLYu03 TaxID=3421656 RepID=UPI003D2993A9